MDTAVRVSAGREQHLVALVGLAVAGVAATVGAALLAHAGAESQPDLSAFARAVMVAVPMAVGAYAWHRGPDSRFGLVLIMAGAGWAVTTLAEADDSLAYTVGRTAGWVVEVLVVYLVLSFPSGRLAERIDRQLAGAMAAVVAVFYGLQLVVADDFSVPSTYTSCIDDCPANALFMLEHQPAFVDAVMRPLGAVLVLVVMTGVVLRLFGRMRDSTPLARRMLVPVVAIAMLRAGALGIAIVGRELEPTAWPIEFATWLLAIAVPAMAFAFLVGLLRWRLFAGAALQHVAECLRSLPDALTLRRAFAEAFDDPTVEIVFPVGDAGDRWMDCWGEPVPAPALRAAGERSARSASAGRSWRRSSTTSASAHARSWSRPASRWPPSCSRTSGSRPRPRHRCVSCSSRARAWRPARSESAGGSSATCTTALSSGS